jgi:hypothetical protein
MPRHSNGASSAASSRVRIAASSLQPRNRTRRGVGLAVEMMRAHADPAAKTPLARMSKTTGSSISAGTQKARAEMPPVPITVPIAVEAGTPSARGENQRDLFTPERAMNQTAVDRPTVGANGRRAALAMTSMVAKSAQA